MVHSNSRLNIILNTLNEVVEVGVGTRGEGVKNETTIIGRCDIIVSQGGIETFDRGEH